MKYYASEIDKYAIQITQKNHPDTIQIGDIKEVSGLDFEGVDLLIGGSPCQGFSFAGKQLNFDDDRSKLFFEFVRVLRQCKPKYFLMENVRMKKEFQDIISKYLGVEPIFIDSNLLSAQNRKRLYWTNIPGIKTPEDLGILLRDIVHENFNEILHNVDVPKFNVNPSGKGMNGNVHCINEYKSNTLTTNKGEGQKISIPLNEYIVPFEKTLQILDKEVERGKVGYFRKDSQANRVYYIHNKAVTLTGSSGGGAAKMGQYLFGVINRPRGTNPGGLRNDGSKCPTISANHWEHNNHLIFGCIPPDRINKRQNGQRFNEGKKFYTLTAQDRHGILVEGYIRKLTPIECERLQTLPDNYSEKFIKENIYLYINEEINRKCVNVQSMDAIGNHKRIDMGNSVFCITKDLIDMDTLKYKKKEYQRDKKCKYCSRKIGERGGGARGMCNRHYQNWLRHGNPLYTDEIRKENGARGYKKRINGKDRHRIVMENYIRRKLNKEEIIHHINLIKTDNRIENLFLCESRSKHSLLHRELERIAGQLVKTGIIWFKNGRYGINKQCTKI